MCTDRTDPSRTHRGRFGCRWSTTSFGSRTVSITKGQDESAPLPTQRRRIRLRPLSHAAHHQQAAQHAVPHGRSSALQLLGRRAQSDAQRVDAQRAPLAVDVAVLGRGVGILAACIFGVGIMMLFLERKDNKEDFGRYETTPLHVQLWCAHGHNPAEAHRGDTSHLRHRCTSAPLFRRSSAFSFIPLPPFTHEQPVQPPAPAHTHSPTPPCTQARRLPRLCGVRVQNRGVLA